jgi:hypothetical protein
MIYVKAKVSYINHAVSFDFEMHYLIGGSCKGIWHTCTVSALLVVG